MSKPQIKVEVAVTYVNPATHAISFHASQDAAIEFGDFGWMVSDSFQKDAYSLLVDPRYDFQEVVDYITNYGKEADNDER